MSGQCPDGPPSGRKESSVRTASRYALFLKYITEIRPDVVNFRLEARQTESNFQQFLRSLIAYK
jgi:hypothetical protein